MKQLNNKNKIDIILPVYNEKNSIERVLKEWIKKIPSNFDYRFIICEDGSTDGTSELLVNLKKKYKLSLNQKKERRGYSKAVLDGIGDAKSDYILCIDSDGQCDPRDFLNFWETRKSSDVLIGWRQNREDVIQRKLFSLMFKIFFKMLFPTNLHDPSAPFVLFKRKKILPYLKHLLFLKEGFWWGFVGMCVKKRILISELPMNHRKRIDGKTNVYLLKKIPFIAIRNLFGLIRLKLS